jgi:hypothetical protein
MSAVQKTDYLPDAATLDLWRVAEEGDLNGLASVLPRVRDINARNEHGVTALMRAAQYGHVKMVRALLERGADANIKRNDKFTALALAAFFGHTEIVRALMEHGADSQAGTRYDTSPHMWATARTFNEVVNQLEKPAPVEQPAPRKTQEPVAAPPSAPIRAVRPPASASIRAVTAPTPAPASVSSDPVVRAVVKTAVVRTLSDPPEIWDLVHEVPRGFNARSAFLTRLKSIHTGWAFRTAAVLVLIAAGTVGVMLLRRVQARNEPTVTKAVQQHNSPQQEHNSPQPVVPSGIPVPAASAVAEPSFVAPEENNVGVSDAPIANRKPAWRSTRGGSRRLEQDSAPRVAAASEVVQPVPTPAAKAAPQEPQPKAATPLSSQMITPAKNSAPKGKVIQWP